MVEQDLVEIRIRADERKLRCFPVEDDLVCVRTKLYPAPEEFFEFRRPARASATASRSWSDRPGLSHMQRSSRTARWAGGLHMKGCRRQCPLCGGGRRWRLRWPRGR